MITLKTYEHINIMRTLTNLWTYSSNTLCTTASFLDLILFRIIYYTLSTSFKQPVLLSTGLLSCLLTPFPLRSEARYSLRSLGLSRHQAPVSRSCALSLLVPNQGRVYTTALYTGKERNILYFVRLEIEIGQITKEVAELRCPFMNRAHR